jgi:FkbM family methyltransferase
MPLTWKDYKASAKCFGIVGALKIRTSRRVLVPWMPSKTFRLRPKNCRYPIEIRHGTSDKYVAIEVLAHRQYAALQSLIDVKTVVDAGANVGTASVFFLSAFPNCRVVSLEPDPGNFSVLEHNLAPYGDRAKAIQIALWGTDEALAISRGGFRDGAEWSFQVTKTEQGNSAEVRGTTISALVEELGWNTIDILKIDIEGAEREVFSAIDTAVLNRIRTIAVELHDSEARRVFERAMAPFGNSRKQIGEVTYWSNPMFSGPAVSIR